MVSKVWSWHADLAHFEAFRTSRDSLKDEAFTLT
jgi:hypothetical protein